MMMFVVGGMSFATTVLVPQFLQANMGYTAESAGMVLSAAGFVLLGALPFIGMLAGRFPGPLSDRDRMASADRQHVPLDPAHRPAD